MLVLATLMLTTSLALAEDAAPTPYTGPTAEQIASAMVEAEELRRPPEPKSAGVSASGFRLFGMNTVSGYRRWGLVEELELQLRDQSFRLSSDLHSPQNCSSAKPKRWCRTGLGSHPA